MQKYILKQQFEGFTVSNTDGIHKGYERFQSLSQPVRESWIRIDWTTHSEDDENYAFMASNSSGSDTQVPSCSNECKESYANLKRLYDAQREQLSDASVEIKASLKGNKSDFENLPLHKRLGKTCEMQAVPPPMTGNYLPSGLDIEIDDSQYTYGLAKTQPSESESQTTELDTWIKREYSNARTPQQNGVAKRKNRTLIEAARTMLADSFLPNTFWAEAYSTAMQMRSTDGLKSVFLLWQIDEEYIVSTTRFPRFLKVCDECKCEDYSKPNETQKTLFKEEEASDVDVPISIVWTKLVTDHIKVSTMAKFVPLKRRWRKIPQGQGKVTPLFDTMLVQPTQDEGASSERLSNELSSPSPAPTSEVPNESLPDSSSAQPSEVPFEQQPDPSPRPLPRPLHNLHHSYLDAASACAKEIKLLKAKINKLKKQAQPIIKHHKAYLKTISLQQRFPRKSFSKKHRVHKEFVSKQGDHMETENAKVKETKEMVDEDKEFDEVDLVLKMQLVLNKESLVPTLKELVPTLKNLFQKIDPKDSSRVEEGESEREGGKRRMILKSEDGLVRLAQAVNEVANRAMGDDEEMARKIQEEWKQEEERK
ncbi:ribonuclease H-like domain-containing protein [Tanacetum coccineum]